MSQIVIVGGGIAGLASAALLARDGHEVTLLEAQSHVGGRAGLWEKDGFRFDTGPSWYLMPEVFDHFYRLLGTSSEEQLSLVTLDPGYRVFFEGDDEPLDIAANRDENLDIFEGIERGAGFKLDKYLRSARETYTLAKKYFLYTNFTDLRSMLAGEVVNRSGHLLRLLLEPLSRKVARTFRSKKLRKVLGYPAVFLGTSPKSAPSMYHLMSHFDLEDGVFYPMGGIHRVIESIALLAAAEGVTVITGAKVKRILVHEGVATGVEYRTSKGEVLFADAEIVVSAADLHHTETQLLDHGQQTYPQHYWDKRTPGPSAVLLYLGIEGSLPELEHHNLLFTKDWDKGFRQIFGPETSVPSPASLYVCKPSGVDPDVAPDGMENVFVLVPIPADPSIGRGGDAAVEAIGDAAIAQIAEWTGVADLAARVKLRRTVGPGDFSADFNSWRGTALGPAHTLRQSAFFRARNVSTRVKGLYFVGSSTIPGIGLPMCLISAEVLVKRLRGDVSTGPLAEPLR